MVDFNGISLFGPFQVADAPFEAVSAVFSQEGRL
jgi:hypothetical protein